MHCAHCKTELDDNARFCTSCGTFVGARETVKPEHITLTFLRADLSGFTKMSEVMNAEDVMAFLNEVFGVFSNILKTKKGVLYDIIGDEIVGVFGYPQGSGFAPHMAIFAAEEMLKHLRQLLAEKNLENPVGLKIGCSMEPASLFSVHDDLRKALVITKGFAKSQILQKNAESNTVLVCERLRNATSAYFSYEEIGEFVHDSISVHAFAYKMEEK